NVVRIAPSILSADASRLGEAVAQAEQGEPDRIHIEVMDGHFVPHHTFGPHIGKWLPRVARRPFELHLTRANPHRLLEALAQPGADTLSVHQEGAIHLTRTTQHIKSRGRRAGVAINPAPPAAMLDEILPDLDLTLAMTVNPGFGGQSFLHGTLSKIRTLR